MTPNSGFNFPVKRIYRTGRSSSFGAHPALAGKNCYCFAARRLTQFFEAHFCFRKYEFISWSSSR
jgi:hypothetical protein